MALQKLVQSANANGAATPATLTLTGVGAGNLLVCVIDVAGTSPTIATPTGDSWVAMQNTGGTANAKALFMLPAAASGSHTPSSVLGGTVTGWIMTIFEFSGLAATQTAGNSANSGSASTSYTNVFGSQSGQAPLNQLFFVSVGRPTATLTQTNTGLQAINQQGVPVGLSTWSSSVQSQAGVQGLSVDAYWGINTQCYLPSVPWPAASGTLGSGGHVVAVAGWFQCAANAQYVSQNGDVVSGQSGTYVPQFYAGTIGG